jgi:hypothetical protein
MMDELKTGSPLVIGKTILLPIEHTVIAADRKGPLSWLTGFKEPHAVIVWDDTGIRAFNTDSIEVPLEPLRQDVPNLDSILAAMTG